MRKIFIWVAHPKPKSLCESIADAYQTGAKSHCGNVRQMNLCGMSFSMDFEGYGKNASPLEPDLLAWQEGLNWADHLLIVHPYWWGAMPTKAKAVIDRALTPGFAFNYRNDGLKWDKLLKGKSADVIITSDTPPIVDTFIYKKPARHVVKNQILGFCGIKTKHIVQFGSVKTASPIKIQTWIERAFRMGEVAAK